MLSCYLTALWGLSGGSGSGGPKKEKAEAVLASDKGARAPSADSGWEAWAGKPILLAGKAAELYEPADGSGENLSFTLKEVLVCTGSGEEFPEIQSEFNSYFQSVSQKNNSVLCYLKDGEALPEAGSMVKVRGTLTPFRCAANPGEFDAAQYYEIRGYLFSLKTVRIEWQGGKRDRLGKALYEIRRSGAVLFRQLLGEEDGAVASAMVLGIKKGMDPEQKELYRDAGIAHLLAISGLHVTMLGAAFQKLLEAIRLPRHVTALLAAAFVFCYGQMTGMSVSTLRAMILFFLMLAAGLLGRTADPLTGLAVAACVILLPNPQYLKDAGFQLSFSAVAGAVVLVPVLQERGLTGGEKEHSRKEKILCRAWKNMTASLGITLATLPVLLFHYYKWNPWSVIANLAAIPLMGVLLPWLLVLAAGGTVLHFLPGAMPVLKLLALPARGIFLLYRMLCHMILQLPGSSLHTGMPKGWQIALYCIGLLLLILWGRKICPALRLPLAVLLTAVFLIRLPGPLQITMLDVGQGECVCLETPKHHFYLIDAGSTSNRSAGKYQMIPFLEYSRADRLEAIFITHWDEDHVNGLEEILEWAQKERISVGRLLLPQTELWDEELQSLLGLAERYGILVERIRAETVMKDGELSLTCLHPYAGETVTDRNASSLVLKLEANSFRALFTGDLEAEGEEWLVRSYGSRMLKADVLDAGHHGAANATGENFLRAVSPGAVLISCGKNNSYGHPAKETLKRIDGQQAACFVTADCGAVTVRAEKEGFRVRTFKKKENEKK